jgi:glycosyltransferase involved in cell wall biosynthesis
MARLVPQKSFDTAVRAIGLLPKSSRWRLWIVGDGPEKSILETEVLKQGVENKVHLFPSTSMPEKWYASADLFLMTSRYEPFGHTLLEAQSSGLQVAGFFRDDKEGILNATAEVVRQGETGWLMPFGDRSLTDLLQKLENSSWAMAPYKSVQTRRWVESTFRWDLFCRKLIDEFAGFHSAL